MDNDIQKFVQIKVSDDGDIKLSHNLDYEGNIYDFMYKKGFRQTKVNGKRIYFKNRGKGLNVIRFDDIREWFFNFLKNNEYARCPEGVHNKDLLNWYLKEKPIKENNLLKHILYVDVSNDEVHEIMMQIDYKYKKEFQILDLTSKLKELKFRKTSDSISSYSRETDLFFRHINKNTYLVFSHFSKSKIAKSEFSVWLSQYGEEGSIGKKKPIGTKLIVQNFKEKDFSLIEKYLI